MPVHIRHWNQEYKIFGHSLWDKIGTATKANSNPNTHYRIGTGDRGAYNKAVLNNTFLIIMITAILHKEGKVQ